MDKNTASGLVTLMLALKKIWPEVTGALSLDTDMEAAQQAGAKALSDATNAHSASVSHTVSGVFELIQTIVEGLDASGAPVVQSDDLNERSPVPHCNTKLFDFVALVGKAGKNGEERRAARLMAAASLCFSLWRRVRSIAVSKCKIQDRSPASMRRALRERFPAFDESTFAEKLDLANDIFVRIASMLENTKEMTVENCFDLALAIRIITEARDKEKPKLGKNGQFKVANAVTRDYEKIERAVEDRLGLCRTLFAQIMILLALVRETAE